jgi:hypothetical protein
VSGSLTASDAAAGPSRGTSANQAASAEKSLRRVAGASTTCEASGAFPSDFSRAGVADEDLDGIDGIDGIEKPLLDRGAACTCIGTIPGDGMAMDRGMAMPSLSSMSSDAYSSVSEYLPGRPGEKGRAPWMPRPCCGWSLLVLKAGGLFDAGGSASKNASGSRGAGTSANSASSTTVQTSSASAFGSSSWTESEVACPGATTGDGNASARPSVGPATASACTGTVSSREARRPSVPRYQARKCTSWRPSGSVRSVQATSPCHGTSAPLSAGPRLHWSSSRSAPCAPAITSRTGWPARARSAEQRSAPCGGGFSPGPSTHSSCGASSGRRWPRCRLCRVQRPGGSAGTTEASACVPSTVTSRRCRPRPSSRVKTRLSWAGAAGVGASPRQASASGSGSPGVR